MHIINKQLQKINVMAVYTTDGWKEKQPSLTLINSQLFYFSTGKKKEKAALILAAEKWDEKT